LKPIPLTEAASIGKQFLFAGLCLITVLTFVSSSAWAGLQVESTWSSNPCPPGKPFHLSVTVSWEDDADHYAVRPPQLELPEGRITQTGFLSSRSFRQGKRHFLTYRWTFIARKKGTIPPIPVKLIVFIKDDKEPASMEIETEILVIDVSRWQGIPVIIILLSGTIFLMAAIICIWFLKRKKPAPPPSSASEETEGTDALPGLMDSLNKNRTHGDTLSFLEIAIKILNLLCPEDNPNYCEIRSLLDQAQYGNLRLSGEEMEQWYLRIKRMNAKKDKY